VAGFTSSNSKTNQNVYIFSRASGNVTLVSHQGGTTATGGNGLSGGSVFSADGRFVGFDSQATNLISGGTVSNKGDSYVYDGVTGQTELISHLPGEPLVGGYGSGLYGLSTDGRYALVFGSVQNLGAGYSSPSGYGAIYRYDRQTGATVLANAAAGAATTVANA